MIKEAIAHQDSKIDISISGASTVLTHLIPSTVWDTWKLLSTQQMLTPIYPKTFAPFGFNYTSFPNVVYFPFSPNLQLLRPISLSGSAFCFKPILYSKLCKKQ